MEINQKKFLMALNELTSGDTLMMVNIKSVLEKTNIEVEKINVVLTELKKDGMIEHSVMGDMVSISHQGIKFSE